jgi:multidrug resistance protein MdtO
MVTAATLIMLISMTFRIPYGYQGAIYALFISRDNPRSALQSGGTIFLVTGIGAVYLLISAWFVISFPLLHFLWIIACFFLAFYVISTMTSYAASSTFATMLAIGVPLWDRHVSAETNVEDTLWLTLGSFIGVAVTAVVELALSRSRPGDDIVVPIVERLSAVETSLALYAQDRPPDHAKEQAITRLDLLGTSALRGALRRSDYSVHYKAQMSAVVSLVARLVDIAAALTQLNFHRSADDRMQLRNLVLTLADLRTDLINRRIPHPAQFHRDDERSQSLPLLREMERVVELIPQAFAGSPKIDEHRSPSDDTPRVKLFRPDVLVNPEHLNFALKGCLAASSCYIIYNAIAWPGISTAVTTCLLTALSTIGSSRQKQVLRFGGALVGGFLFGMGSQIFILPCLDSIGGFTLLFILVTIVAAWVMTSSPRLSYFGFQIAVAFYLINVQEFAMQTSLAVARDRVVGILLGLFMMWLAFDQLWSAPAAVEMRRAFISNLRLLAQLEREPLAGTEKTWNSFPPREMIEANFNKVRGLADGVLFEFGPSRQQDLALRHRIRRWQSRLQTFFLLRIALLKYRLRLPGFELPERLHVAQQDFDDYLAKTLDGMADRWEGKASERTDDLEDAFDGLEKTARSCYSEGPQGLLGPDLQTFLALSRSIENVMLSLDDNDI